MLEEKIKTLDKENLALKMVLAGEGGAGVEGFDSGC